MDLHTVRHGSDLFTVYPERKELVTYISDLQANSPNGEAWGRVYDDACDEGFTIVSVRTGQEAVFAQEETKRDPEGDILVWELIPTRDTIRRIPSLKGWTAVLIND